MGFIGWQMFLTDIDKALAAADRCIVCNRRATHEAIYRSKDRTGVSVYGLCGRHIEYALIIGDQVEARFERDFGNNQRH